MAKTRRSPTRNWLGLMKGDLEEDLRKGRQTVTRKLHGDRIQGAGRRALHGQGRSLMLVRNVGHLMTTPPCSMGRQ
jgi:malate synthase